MGPYQAMPYLHLIEIPLKYSIEIYYDILVIIVDTRMVWVYLKTMDLNTKIVTVITIIINLDDGKPRMNPFRLFLRCPLGISLPNIERLGGKSTAKHSRAPRSESILIPAVRSMLMWTLDPWGRMKFISNL